MRPGPAPAPATGRRRTTGRAAAAHGGGRGRGTAGGGVLADAGTPPALVFSAFARTAAAGTSGGGGAAGGSGAGRGIHSAPPGPAWAGQQQELQHHSGWGAAGIGNGRGQLPAAHDTTLLQLRRGTTGAPSAGRMAGRVGQPVLEGI